MFTYSKVHLDETHVSKGRRDITIEFIDGKNLAYETMSFAIGTDRNTIKKRFKHHLDTILNAPEKEDITDLVVVEDAPVEPTVAELARTAYDKDRGNLTTIMELVRDGVFTGTEKQITDLQAKVRQGFKAEYLG